MGTELSRRGVPTPLPAWSGTANETAPDAVAAVHRSYVEAGATVHTANTFRTRQGSMGSRWGAAARAAVRIARSTVPPHHTLLGSIAPVADCYRPDLADPTTWSDHARIAALLSEAGVDGLLCETFPHADEGLAAVCAAVATGLPTWLALTPGPDGALMSPAALAKAAARAVDLGAARVGVNCVSATLALPYVRALVSAGLSPMVYANAGKPDDAMGWRSEPGAPDRYRQYASSWVDAGAIAVGGCCGTGPDHIRAVAGAFKE